MTRFLAGIGWLALGAIGWACGGRSELAGAETPGGTGGTGATTVPPVITTTATGPTSSDGGGGGGVGGAGTGGIGVGGGGGGDFDCSVLALAGPPASLDGGETFRQLSPVWTLSSNDGSRATLVSASQAVLGPGGEAPISVQHTSLEPWVDFPSGGILGATHLVDPVGGASFRAAPANGNRFAVLYTNAPPSDGLLFSDLFHAFEDGPPPSPVIADATAERAVFAAHGPAGHLLGTMLPGASGSGNAYLMRAAVALGGGALLGPFAVGCASSEMRGGAVRAGDGWLMAISNGGSFGDGDCADPGVGQPDMVQIVAVDDASFELKDGIGAPGGATGLAVAGRNDGAWVVVGTPPGQVVNGMLVGHRIDKNGIAQATVQLSDPIFDIPDEGSVGATRVGDYLATVWMDFGGDKGPHLLVKTFDKQGNPAGQVQVFPSTPLSGIPSILGSPFTGSLLLAWSELPEPGQGGGERIQAVRIDCVGAP